jgi:transcriptional regulator with XRE-family HTH domain
MQRYAPLALMAPIAEQLDARRLALRIPIKAIADLLGISTSQALRKLNGKAELRTTEAEKIAEYLKADGIRVIWPHHVA